MLGMTATQRTDDGNIFKLFDNNIAYEIRLPKSLGKQNTFAHFIIMELPIMYIMA